MKKCLDVGFSVKKGIRDSEVCMCNLFLLIY